MKYIKGLIHYFCCFGNNPLKALFFPQKFWWKISVLAKVSEKNILEAVYLDDYPKTIEK